MAAALALRVALLPVAACLGADSSSSSSSSSSSGGSSSSGSGGGGGGGGGSGSGSSGGAAAIQVEHEADGSFVVKVDGSPWLHSGELKIHTNDEWHSMHPEPAPPTPGPPHCTAGLQNTDQIGATSNAGPPVYNTTDASCCAACLENTLCDTWVRATEPAGNIPQGACFLLVGASRTEFQRNATTRNMGFIHRRSHSTVATGSIVPDTTPVTASHGSNHFGEYEKTSWYWVAKGTRGKPPVRFSTSILAYSDGHSAVFEQSIPSGAAQTNYSAVDIQSGGKWSSPMVQPFLHFPSFNVTNTEGVYGAKT
jgi:hypothetical protein